MRRFIWALAIRAIFALCISFRFHTWVSERMIIFNQALLPLSPGDDEADLPTDDTFKDPAMSYFHKIVTDPRGRSKELQGLEGLQYWLSGAACPDTDRYLLSHPSWHVVFH